jgi:methylenetetrahydrofolate--tRNA-(uracil-5-)-methyltransferase
VRQHHRGGRIGEEHLPPVRVVGGGLAGSEAAFQLAKRGVPVHLHEMRLGAGSTPAHRSRDLGELVCSNSFKSTDSLTASGLFKRELSLMGSLLLEKAFESQVPAGTALAVDRNAFSHAITGFLSSLPGIVLSGEEVVDIDPAIPTVIATGPLTSPGLAGILSTVLGEDHLSFYDAISPILSSSSIDRENAYLGTRYGKAGDDYLNCPLDREEYARFYEALITAESAPHHEFEEEKYFEACLPVEVIAKRGKESLLFGPMRPVGLSHPVTGRRPYAVVQLRREDREGSMWNMVGFQTRLTYPAQAKVFRMIPALRDAEFFRYGSVHRNTFVNSPAVLTEFFQPKRPGWENVILAGQLTGVEGYVESIASGLLAGINISRILEGKEPVMPPRATMTGSLFSYIAHASPDRFQPMNVNFGLLPAPAEAKGRERKRLQGERAIAAMEVWVRETLS